jgi:hypothetical protein
MYFLSFPNLDIKKKSHKCKGGMFVGSGPTGGNKTKGDRREGWS